MQVKRDWPIQYQAVRAEPTWPWHGQVSVERDLFLRSSTYGSAELCPGRVRHANDDGFQGEASEAMFFGTVCHELCGNEAVEGDAVYRTWSQVWEKALALAERDHLDLASKMPSGMESLWCTEALGLLASWRQWWATFRASHPQVTVLLGERPMVARSRVGERGTSRTVSTTGRECGSEAPPTSSSTSSTAQANPGMSDSTGRSQAGAGRHPKRQGTTSTTSTITWPRPSMASKCPTGPTWSPTVPSGAGMSTVSSPRLRRWTR
jgi:hypothetical protein